MATRSPTSTRTATDKLEIEEFVRAIEDRLAQFVDAEFAAARLIAHISAQVETGRLAQERANGLLDDAYRLCRLAQLGRQAHKWLRTPPAQLEMMVLRGLTLEGGDF